MKKINYNKKLYFHLFNENLTSEKYLEILKEALPELNEISKEKRYLQMDNARVHWTIGTLKIYKDTNIFIVDLPSFVHNKI